MSKCVLGIDVGKKELALALLKDGHFYEKNVSNSPAGFEKLLKFLNNYNVVDAKCYLESTGSYSEAIADFLCDQKITVIVVNPYKIASFAKSKLSRIKTDKKDAKLIAEYGCISNDRPYEKPSETLRCIRALYRTYLKQTQMSSACKNQIEHATVEEDKIIWQKTLDEFENNRTKIINRITELISSDEKIKLQFNMLQTTGHSCDSKLSGGSGLIPLSLMLRKKYALLLVMWQVIGRKRRAEGSYDYARNLCWKRR